MKVHFNHLRKYEVIEDGRYAAVLVSITPKTTVYGDSYQFLFVITDDKKYDGRKIGKLLKPSKMMLRWIELLTGGTVDTHSEYELDNLLYASCEIQVEVTTDNKNRIVDIYALKEEETNGKRE